MLHRRKLHRENIHQSVEMIAEHPVIGPRYGPALDDLRQAWLELVGSEAMKSLVLEHEEGGRSRVIFVGVSVCVQDQFVQELKTGRFWCGPELANRVRRKQSPLLTDQEVREANSFGGMNLVTWIGHFRPEFEAQSELHRRQMEVFIDLHRGYRWKEIIASGMENADRLIWTLNSGGMLWDREKGAYIAELKQDPEEIIKAPHVVGVTRDLDRARPGSWVGGLFDYDPPRMGFSPREQQLLTLALEGLTDEALCRELNVSLTTIKKAWLSVYAKVSASSEGLISSGETGHEIHRGKEKRRSLLAYLRRHPEELRPFKRKGGR